MPEDPQAPDPIKLAVIIGSVREGRRGAVLADWFVSQVASRTDIEIDLIDLAQLDFSQSKLPVRGPDVRSFAARVGDADAFVIVTPEYNHSFPASLKAAIDYVKHEWYTKPIGFVSYGGMARGTRAVQQLRQVFGELHAVTIRDGVMIDLGDAALTEHGVPRDGVGFDYSGTAKFMVDELIWWGRALRDARTVRPYVA